MMGQWRLTDRNKCSALVGVLVVGKLGVWGDRGTDGGSLYLLPNFVVNLKLL